MRGAALLAGAAVLRANAVVAAGRFAGKPQPLDAFGALRYDRELRMWLPEQGIARLVAQSRRKVRDTSFVWHGAPDGGGCVPRTGGGWTYVSNAELNAPRGAVSALDFDGDGELVGARELMTGGDRLCGGGVIAGRRWLSCEEVPHGSVWEVDVSGARRAVRRPALGLFMHEAAAEDPGTGHIYLTEDQHDGALYRFVPLVAGQLDRGELQVLTGRSGELNWSAIPDPSAARVETRLQAAHTLHFDGGEGAWFQNGELTFVTKGDDRVWVYSASDNSLRVLYDAATHPNPLLSGVDTVAQDWRGRRFVAEDKGDMQICVITASGTVGVLVQLNGNRGSEITGLAFNPAGDRLYFSSQRSPGRTYELRMPFADLV